jgi:hypothetical protein
MNSRYSRRSLVQSAAVAAAVTTVPSWYIEQIAPARAETIAANDKPGIALIGCGGRGKAVAREAALHGDLIAWPARQAATGQRVVAQWSPQGAV